jgi:hypothetical protein
MPFRFFATVVGSVTRNALSIAPTCITAQYGPAHLIQGIADERRGGLNACEFRNHDRGDDLIEKHINEWRLRAMHADRSAAVARFPMWLKQA